MAPMGLGLDGMALGGGIGRSGGSLPYWINLSPATTSRIKAGYDAMLAGTRNMNIAWTGSSVDRGVDETASPYGSQYRLSVAEQLAAVFRADGIASGANNWYAISGASLNDYDIRDDRFTAAGTAAMGSSVVKGGAGLSMSSATATMSFTPQGNVNTADIYTLQNSAFNGAQLQVLVDGVPTATITQDATNTIRKTTVPLGAVGPHTITINWVSGANALYGIDCYDNTRKEVTVRQWATSGGTMSGMIDNSGAPSAGRLRQIQLFPPDVIMGDIGVVNTWRAPAVSVATAKAQAETYIDAIQAAGADFIFVVPPFDSGSAGNTANQQAYIDAIIASCIAKGCAVFNLRAAPGWTSKAASDAAGYTVASDAVHKTIAGQASTAALLKDGMNYALLGGVTGPAIPTAFTLTDIASGQLFQRAAGSTSGPVRAGGTYSGGEPSAIELQVRKVSDNSVVKSWTVATATIGGGAWSASITDVAQGGSYYVEARPSNATGLAKTGSNPFFVGIMLIGYGQSNWLNHMGAASSPAAALDGTCYFNGANWAAVPSANGVRNLLNGIRTLTGVPVGIVSGGHSGVKLEVLQKGSGSGDYENLAAAIAASGGDAEFIVFHQGEGDAVKGAPTNATTWQGQLDTLHGDIGNEVGRTKTQLKLILSSLGVNSGGAGASADDASWDYMQRTLLDAASTLTGVYFSHSNMDGTNAVGDTIHWDAATYGRSGDRYAQTIAVLNGDQVHKPAWYATAATRVDATHTDITTAHDMGTDFTPTSGITGFDISNDNGTTWAAATGARQSATVIRLTHADLGTVERKIRFGYGMLPDTSGVPKDNGSLTVPIVPSAGNLTAAAAATLPTPTFRASLPSTGSGGVRTSASQSIGAAAPDRKLLIFVTGNTGTSQTLTNLVVTPNVGSPVTATPVLVQTTLTNPFVAAFVADVPDGTTATFTITFSGTIFFAPEFHIWTVPANDLASASPVASVKNQNASGTSISLNIATSAGGFVVAAATLGSSGATCVVSGTETYATRSNNYFGGAQQAAADSSNVSANANSVVTANFSGGASGIIGLIAMSFR